MQSLLRKHTLSEVCALQWQQCVDKSEQAFATMPADKVLRVRYENFIQDPSKELTRILEFIGLCIQPDKIIKAVEGVSTQSLGKGRAVLSEEEVKNLKALVGDTLKRYGYD